MTGFDLCLFTVALVSFLDENSKPRNSYTADVFLDLDFITVQRIPKQGYRWHGYSSLSSGHSPELVATQKKHQIINIMRVDVPRPAVQKPNSPLAHAIRHITEVENRSFLFTADPIVLEHPRKVSALVARILKARSSSLGHTCYLCAHRHPPLADSASVSRPRERSGCRSADRTRHCEGETLVFVLHEEVGYAYLSSNSAASLRKHFLHFLHANT